MDICIYGLGISHLDFLSRHPVVRISKAYPGVAAKQPARSIGTPVAE